MPRVILYRIIILCSNISNSFHATCHLIHFINKSNCPYSPILSSNIKYGYMSYKLLFHDSTDSISHERDKICSIIKSCLSSDLSPTASSKTVI